MTVYETVTLQLAIQQRDQALGRLDAIRALCAHGWADDITGHTVVRADQVLALLGPDPMQGRDQQEDDA